MLSAGPAAKTKAEAALSPVKGSADRPFLKAGLERKKRVDKLAPFFYKSYIFYIYYKYYSSALI